MGDAAGLANAGELVLSSEGLAFLGGPAALATLPLPSSLLQKNWQPNSPQQQGPRPEHETSLPAGIVGGGRCGTEGGDTEGENIEGGHIEGGHTGGGDTGGGSTGGGAAVGGFRRGHTGGGPAAVFRIPLLEGASAAESTIRDSAKAKIYNSVAEALDNAAVADRAKVCVHIGRIYICI